VGISLGLVGLGNFGASFAPLFKGHPLVDRIALCDREPDRVKTFAEEKSFGDKFDPADAYETFEDICKADLDAVAIITQPWLHAEQAIAAMEAGKHVYSAVPIVMLPDGDEILDWCDKLIETCKKTGQLYMLGETTYFHPEAMYCRRRAAAGDFGEFVYAEGEYYHPFNSAGCNLKDVRRARMSSKSGLEWAVKLDEYAKRGILDGPMHYPTHSVSGPLCVMKAHATKVSGFGFGPASSDEYFDDQRFSNETALFTLSNSATMRINEFREIGHRASEVFRVFGTEGSYREDSWQDQNTKTELTVEEMRDKLPEEVERGFAESMMGEEVYGNHCGSHPYLVHEFVESVAQGRMPAINAWEAVRYMAPGVMAHKSALKDGEWLEVPDWGDAP